MDKYPKWPHLENLDRVLSEYDPGFLTAGEEYAEWTVTEKVHGFNARFGVTIDGEPWVGSRNQVVATADPGLWPRDGLQGFIGFAADHVGLLVPGETVFGEWAGKGIQKGIDYGERDFYLFGSQWGVDETYWDSWGSIRVMATLLKCKTVPVVGVYREGPPGLDYLTGERDAESLIAAQTREGVVIYRWPIPTDQHGNLVIAKFKSARFNEVAKAPRAAKELPDVEQVMSVVRRYATPQRMEHVLQQVQETYLGNDPLDVRYTGDVMRAMHDDIVREAGSEYDELSDEAKKVFGKALNPTTKRLLDDARMAAAVAA